MIRKYISIKILLSLGWNRNIKLKLHSLNKSDSGSKLNLFAETSRSDHIFIGGFLKAISFLYSCLIVNIFVFCGGEVG